MQDFWEALQALGGILADLARSFIGTGNLATVPLLSSLGLFAILAAFGLGLLLGWVARRPPPAEEEPFGPGVPLDLEALPPLGGSPEAAPEAAMMDISDFRTGAEPLPPVGPEDAPRPPPPRPPGPPRR